MASITSPTPAVPMGTPTRSIFPVAAGFFDSRSRRGAIARTSAASGTLIQKMPRHDHTSVRTAPRAGPTTAPSAPVAPVIPMTVDRLLAGKSGSTTAIAVARMIAPPTPWSTREAISAPGVRRERAQHRPDDEDRDAGKEEPFAPVAVGVAPGDEQQCGDGDRVARDDPTERRLGHVEVVADRGERDVDRRDVDDDEEEDEGDDAERQPRVAIAEFALDGRCVAIDRHTRAPTADPMRSMKLSA